MVTDSILKGRYHSDGTQSEPKCRKAPPEEEAFLGMNLVS